VRWYRKAAEAGHVKAQSALATMYSFGKGVPRDETLALSWYLEAAEKGDAKAQNNLGAIYKSGEGASLDYRAAAAWYRNAAEQGYPRAMANQRQHASLVAVSFVGRGARRRPSSRSAAMRKGV